MTDVYIKYMESKLREQSAEIERLRASLARAKTMERDLNATIDELEKVVERQSRRLMEQARSLERVRATITSDEAVEAFGKAWSLQSLGLPRVPGEKRRAGLRAVADLIGGAE